MAKATSPGSAPFYGSSGLMPRPALDRTRRTNNRLIRGPFVDVPATSGLVTAPTPIVNKTISYPYTDDNNTAAQGNVIIPKGHILAFNVTGNVDFADLDGAAGPGTVENSYVVGLSYLNLFQPVRDRLAGNRPGLAIKGYFELPVFADRDAAVGADHRWGAILASANTAMKPGDTLRLCGTNTDGAGSVGWLTNQANGAAGKLGPYAGEIIAQILEFDEGPVFDGLTEWVQPEDPREFEDAFAYWTGGDAARGYFRDPNSPTGFSYGPSGGVGMNAYGERWPNENGVGQPELQTQPYKDAAGIPGLTDGINWQSIQSDTVGAFTGAVGQTTATFVFYYHTFGDVGAALNADGTAINAETSLYQAETLTGNTIVTWGDTAAGAALTWTFADDGRGTITVTASDNGPAVIAGTDFPQQAFYFLAKGQVAGVPVNFDVASCLGLARFQLLIR